MSVYMYSMGGRGGGNTVFRASTHKLTYANYLTYAAPLCEVTHISALRKTQNNYTYTVSGQKNAV